MKSRYELLFFDNNPNLPSKNKSCDIANLNLVLIINEYNAKIEDGILRDVLGGIEQKQPMIVNAALFRSLLDLENEDLLKNASQTQQLYRYCFYKEVIVEIIEQLKNFWQIYLSEEEDFIYLNPPHIASPKNLKHLNDKDFHQKFLSHRERKKYFTHYNVDNLGVFIGNIIAHRKARIFLIGHGLIDENNILDRDKAFREENRTLFIEPELSVNRAAGLSLNEYQHLLKNLSQLSI